MLPKMGLPSDDKARRLRLHLPPALALRSLPSAGLGPSAAEMKSLQQETLLDDKELRGLLGVFLQTSPTEETAHRVPREPRLAVEAAEALEVGGAAEGGAAATLRELPTSLKESTTRRGRLASWSWVTSW